MLGIIFCKPSEPIRIYIWQKLNVLTQKKTQICDGWELQEHVRLPLFTKQQNPREICLLMVAILTCLHWSCMLSVFGQRRWKRGYLPGIIVATFTTLLPIATLVRDPTMVFLGLLPLVIDVYTSACLVFDYAYEKGKGLRSRDLG